MKDTLKFFEIAKPKLTKRDFFSQYAVHLEEFSESVEAMGCKGSDLYDELKVAIKELQKASNENDYLIDSFHDKMNRVLMLDSLCDQYVTLIGTARTLGMDIQSAIKEVEASNLSKFEYVGNRELNEHDFKRYEVMCNGIMLEGRYKGVHWKRVGEYVVFYDGNGKILKSPSTYFEPNLEKFV